MIYLLHFVYEVDCSDGFPYIEPSLHPWEEAYLIMVNYHFDRFLDLIHQNFVEYFCIDAHKADWSEFLFACLVFGLGMSFYFVEYFEKYPS